jgi:exosome complex RNA-binding protein Rrp4
MTDTDVITALIEVNNDLRRELDAANKTIKELYDENDRLLKKVLNAQTRRDRD